MAKIMTLTIRVEYDRNGVSEAELRDLLVRGANHLFEQGYITGETEAEVKRWSATVTVGTERRSVR